LGACLTKQKINYFETLFGFATFFDQQQRTSKKRSQHQKHQHQRIMKLYKNADQYYLFRPLDKPFIERYFKTSGRRNSAFSEVKVYKC
jgi:hypothetical protein